MHTPSPKRFRLSLPAVVAMVLFFVANAYSDEWIRDQRAAGWWLPGTVLSVLALVYLLWRSERDFMATHDELQYRIRAEASTRAFPCALAIVLLLSKLRAAGYDLPPQVSRLAWVLALLPYFPILAWVRRRYE